MHKLEAEFYDWLDRTADIDRRHFENNWPYIVQATRNGLHIHRTSDAIVYRTHRFHGDSRSKTVIAHSLGDARRDAVLALAREECSRGVSVVLKNVPQEEVVWWQGHGFVTPSEWDKYSLRDDNTFPQYVIDADSVRTIAYKRDHRKIVRQFTRLRQIVPSEYDARFDSEAYEILESFARYLAMKGAASYQEAIRAHEFFFDNSIVRKMRIQFLEAGKLIGFAYLTPVGQLAYFNALVARPENDLPKYLTHLSRLWVLDNSPQVKFLIDQGSEKAGQDLMKMRFGSQKLGDKVHLELSTSSTEF